MWNLLKGLVSFIGTKPLASMAGKMAMKKRWLNMKTSAVFMLGVPVGMDFFFGEPNRSFGERVRDITVDVGLWALTLGTRSIGRQFLAWSMLQALPHFPEMGRKFVRGYRSALEARTAAAVPFAHSNFPMDHAFAMFQYSRTRMQDAYSTVGAEAPMFAARYMSR